MKPSPSTLVRASGLAIAVMLFGCDTEPNRVPRSTQTVDLSYEHASEDVAMDVVTAIKVVLPPGPAAASGDVWEIASNNNKVLLQTSPLRGDPASVSTVTFYALKPGRSVLRFVLVPPGQAEAVPAAKCEVTVRVSE
jgi:hypothetical protein